MPLAGPMCCQDGNPASFDNCIAKSREGHCQHSVPLLRAMQLNSTRRKGIGISSSVLSMCPRQYVLGEANDYYEDPAAYYPKWRGAFGHYAIEMGGPYPGIAQEVRFYRTVNVLGLDFEISGQPDWVDVEHRHIDDSKFVGFRPKEPYKDHEAQINVYHWLMIGGYVKGDYIAYPGDYQNPIPENWEARAASITYRDTKGEAQYPIGLWSMDAVESYVRRRLEPHARYIKTGNLALLKIEDDVDFWKAKYCPFQDPRNPGRCCMASDGV